MDKKENILEKENLQEQEEQEQETTIEQEDGELQDEENNEKEVLQEDIKAIKAQLEEQTKKSEEYFNALQRTMAEFDNFRKRTIKEKENIYQDAVSDTVAEMLPVLDNLQRAIDTCKENAESAKLLEGVEMVLKQFKDSLSKLGVEEIKAVGENFDPELHNAVMHIEDEMVDENTIVEEFQKGYKVKDRVIRHSMVKVAN